MWSCTAQCKMLPSCVKTVVRESHSSTCPLSILSIFCPSLSSIGTISQMCELQSKANYTVHVGRSNLYLDHKLDSTKTTSCICCNWILQAVEGLAIEDVGRKLAIILESRSSKRIQHVRKVLKVAQNLTYSKRVHLRCIVHYVCQTNWLDTCLVHRI